MLVGKRNYDKKQRNTTFNIRDWIMVTSQSQGYNIYYDNTAMQWKYEDNNEIFNSKKLRPCQKCKEVPLLDQYDGCIGYLDSVIYACCGHGIHKPYVIFSDGEYKQFDNIKSLKKYFLKGEK